MSFKKDFPIFEKNKDLIYFDSTATSQKPSMVIDAMKEYMETNYSNIHRWAYDIAINSEDLYLKSKKIIAKHLKADSHKEIIYTYNSTYASNILVASLKKSNYFSAGDKVLLTIAEHHANILPWLILKEEVWVELEYIKLDENFNLDLEDFDKKYDEKVKVIAFTHVSNVLWTKFDLEEIWRRKRNDTLFVIDASQSVPHFELDVRTLNCDALFFTWHKVFSDTGIWVLWGKTELLNSLTPAFSWGWAISDVTCSSYSTASLPDKFEMWTPHIIGAVSLLKAFEYIESIWWYEAIEKQEDELVEYFLEKFNQIDSLEMLGSTKAQNRVWVFSFIVKWHHSKDVSDSLADHNIAVRAWKHCAHPLLLEMNYPNSIRASLYIYNTKDEIDRFFEVLEKIINN